VRSTLFRKSAIMRKNVQWMQGDGMKNSEEEDEIQEE
jgi:hypothetical protein